MVRYLFPFINNNKLCPTGAYTVGIEKEIEKYRLKNPGSKPTIIFDFVGCITIFIKGTEILSGGRLDLGRMRIEKFLKRLKNMNIDLVFFVDGQIKEDKFPIWLQRVNSKYETQGEIFQKIKDGESIDLPYNGQSLFCLYDVFLRISKKYGKVFVSLHNECDLDLAAYAMKIRAAAVVSSDTDFLIMPGDWPIWLPATVDLERLTVIAWNKKSLRTALDLKQSQLPIYSILSGNDWISRERVLHFHNILRGGIIQQRIAEYIRRHFPRGVPLTSSEFHHLLDIIYNNGKNSCTKEEAAKLIMTSLMIYSYNDHKIPETSPLWLKKCVEDTCTNFIYSLVKDLPIVVHQSFIDLSKKDVRPYCELALPIIRKQMGITDFYKDRKNREQKEIIDSEKNLKKRIIYMKPSHEEPYQEQTTTPIFPDFDIPPLNILLGYDVTEEENARLMEKRLEIFCWIISTKRHRVTPEIFKKTELKIYLISALVLTYLVKEFQITSEEADIMLLSIHETIQATEEKLEAIGMPNLYNERAFWLSQVFLRLRRLYLDSLLLCGINEYRECDSYDGFIFHKMYTKYQSLDGDTKLSLREPIEDYRIYAKAMP